MAIDSGVLTIMVGVMGILFGSLISPYINHRLTQRYQQRDLFFKKKMEYFEKIVEDIENNIRLYKHSLKKAEGKKSTGKIITLLKKERKNFLILTSPIYMSTVNLSSCIRHFTEIEREIFAKFSELEKRKKDKDEIINSLKEDLASLKKAGNKIIFEMKLEIKKEIK